MKLKGIVPIVIILTVLFLSATTIESESSGLRALGFIAGSVCGTLFNMWIDHNL